MVATFSYKNGKFAMEIADKCNFLVDIFYIVNAFKSSAPETSIIPLWYVRAEKMNFHCNAACFVTFSCTARRGNGGAEVYLFFLVQNLFSSRVCQFYFPNEMNISHMSAKRIIQHKVLHILVVNGSVKASKWYNIFFKYFRGIFLIMPRGCYIIQYLDDQKKTFTFMLVPHSHNVVFHTATFWLLVFLFPMT